MAIKGRIVYKGGKGSGNHGHSGRPGKVGGSGGGSGVAALVETHGRNDDYSDWPEGAIISRAADTKSIGIIAEVPGVHIHQVDGSNAYQSSVTGYTRTGYSKVRSALAEAGYKRSSALSGRASHTFVKGSAQISVAKTVDTGGPRGGERKIIVVSEVNVRGE